MSYDIIGDIHGHDGALIGLLQKMGYYDKHSVWRHPERTAIFVGDFIDRGPGQLETLRIVRNMVEAGSALAVMGNHEFNAIAWHTPHPGKEGEYLRARSAKNHAQHAAFLAETEHDPALRQDIIDWFLTLPLWIELPGLRVIHACWHPGQMAILKPHLDAGNRLNMDLVHAASQRGSDEFIAVETILKGPEVTLPDGLKFVQGGVLRNEARTRWWDANATTFKQSALVDAQTESLLPDLSIPEAVRPGYDGDRPVFIGHYWMSGVPQLLAPRVACVDYSVAKSGPLVAYRWDGERDLHAESFEFYPVSTPGCSNQPAAGSALSLRSATTVSGSSTPTAKPCLLPDYQFKDRHEPG